MPDPITGPPTSASQLVTSTGLDPSITERSNGFDSDTFLQLMVAQLKYQNPLSPMDSSEFMSQTAQFTTVEELTQLTEQLSHSLANDRLGTATQMIGREVSYVGGDGEETGGVVTSIRFLPAGPLLLMADGTEIGLGDITSVTTPAPDA